MKWYSIYKLTAPGGLIYIGFTSRTGVRRFKEHCWEAARGSPFPLHKAIRKYGARAFTIETIGRYETAEQGLAAEVVAIASMRSTVRGVGYNISPGGDRPPSFAGKTLTRAHKLNCSKARKRWHQNRKSDDHFSKMVTTRKATGSYDTARNGSTIRISCDGVVYESIAKLCRSIHIGRAKVFEMMRSGQIKAVGSIPEHYSSKYSFLGNNGAAPGHFTKDLANRGPGGMGLPR